MLINSLVSRVRNYLIYNSRDRIAKKHLMGTGIEIGALHLPLTLEEGTKVKYVDRMPTYELRKHYPELRKHNLVEPDIIENGEKLLSIKEESLDFIVANHFLEHCEDVIGTLKVFMGKLKVGGKLFLAIPDKRFTFDSSRNCTIFSHILYDHVSGTKASRFEHYLDWVRNVEARNSTIVDIGARAQELMDSQYSIHFHVWDYSSIIELFETLRKTEIPNLSSLDCFFNRNEVIFIGQRDR